MPFFVQSYCLQCFDGSGWVAGRASRLWKSEWWNANMVMCLGQSADLYMAQLMPLLLTISCPNKSRLLFFWCRLTQVFPDRIQKGRKAVVCVCVCVLCVCVCFGRNVCCLSVCPASDLGNYARYVWNFVAFRGNRGHRARIWGQILHRN